MLAFDTLYYGYTGMTVIYWSCVLLFGTPLAQPTLHRVTRYAVTACNLSTLKQVTLHLLWWRPLFGCLLFLDDFLLGSFYRTQRIVQPLFVISGARSGSTTLGHLLDCDDKLCGPTLVFSIFPFLTVALLWSATVGKFVTPEQIEGRLNKQMLNEEMLVRHEAHPITKPDTYDMALFARQWVGMIALPSSVGPNQQTGPSKGLPIEGNTWQWQLTKAERVRAVGLIDETCRKWLWLCGADKKEQHLLLKGHMVDMVPALKQRYPDASFVTVMREPLSMATSMVPFAGATPGYAGPEAAVAWPWFNFMFVEYFNEYCKQELALVKRGDMMGVPFKQLISDPASVMQSVKQWSATQWGAVVVNYSGSKHEAQLLHHQSRSDVVQEKAWRKSLKSKYPSQKVEKLMELAAETSTRMGLPSLDEDSAFKEYRNHMQALEKTCYH